MKRLVRALAFGGLFFVLSAGAALASSFTVTLDTSPLSGPQILLWRRRRHRRDGGLHARRCAERSRVQR